MAKLITHAKEKSTYIITASFYDESETLVTPNSGLTWKLTDENGTVINSRSSVALTSASTVNIVLSGDDLALGNAARSGKRYVTITGTYDSSLGSGLYIKEQVEFEIDNLVSV